MPDSLGVTMLPILGFEIATRGSTFLERDGMQSTHCARRVGWQ